MGQSETLCIWLRAPFTPPLRLLPLLLLLILLAVASGASADDGDDAPREPDASITFQALQQVAATSALNYFAPTPVLRVAPNGRTMLSYNRVIAPDVQNPYFSVFDQTTRTWSTPQPIRNSPTHLRYGTITFDGASQAHAIWLDGNNVYYAAESGWPSTAKKLSTSTQNIVDPPAITIGADGAIHVVWSQGTNLLTVYHVYSRNGGNTWSAPLPLTGAGEDASTVAVAATANSSVHVVWERPVPDVPSYRYEIYHRQGIWQGSSYSWSGPVKVSLSLTTAKRPTLAAEGNNLHLGFASQVSGSEQYAYYRRLASGSWGTLVNVNAGHPVGVNTNNPYDLFTSVTVCGGVARVFFHGAPMGAVNERVWAGVSSDNWQSVSPITPLGERYIYPTIGCRNGSLVLGLDRVATGSAHEIYAGIEEKRVWMPLIRGR